MSVLEHTTRMVTLRGPRAGEKVTLRPATPDDVPKITAYLMRMPDEERKLRYLCELPSNALVVPGRLDHVYRQTLDYETHMCLVVVNDLDEVIGVTHAYGPNINADGRYEISYSRDVRYRRAGVGTALLRGLISWAEHSGISGLYSDILLEAEHMRTLLESLGFCRSEYLNADNETFRYRLDLARN